MQAPKQDLTELQLWSFKLHFFFLFQVPSITMAMYSVACAASSLGFIQATLEPHLRSFNMTPLIIGSMFVVSGGCYGFSAPLWGMICDKYPPKMVTLVGKDAP